MKIKHSQDFSELKWELNFKTNKEVMSVTYIPVSLTKNDIDNIDKKPFLAWIPYITHCNNTVHVLRFRLNHAITEDIWLTSLPIVPNSVSFNHESKKRNADDESSRMVELPNPQDKVVSRQASTSTDPSDVVSDVFPMFQSSNLTNNSSKTVIPIIDRMNHGNFYVKQKIRIQNNYFVMCPKQTEDSNSIMLLIKEEKIIFRHIPSVSARFRSMYKIFSAANCNEGWTKLSNENDDWSVLKQSMPTGLHQNLLKTFSHV